MGRRTVGVVACGMREGVAEPGRRIESKDGVGGGGPCWGRERGWEVRMVWVAG